MRFRYFATELKTGCRISEIAEAESYAVLIKRLKEQGLKNIKINTIDAPEPKPRSFSPFKRVSRKEIKIFTRQLASTLGAGFILTDALESLAEDLENTGFGTILKNIRDDVNSGVFLSKALSRYPKIFPVSYTSVVEAGEATGWLHTTMSDLARYLEDSDRLRQKVRSAISYPVFVLSFALLIVSVIMLFIIPRFKSLFEQLGSEMPLVTRVVIGASEFLLNNFALFLTAGILLIALFRMALRFPRTKVLLDVLKLKIPLVGKEIIHKSLIAQFCRTLGFLLQGGVPLSQSLQITRGIINHVPLQDGVYSINEHVVAGGMISEVIKNNRIFPNFVFKMVSLGEKSGKLNEMLNRAADYYEEEIEFSINKLTSLLEPVLIVFVGFIVFIVIISLYMPIFRISQIIR